MKKKKPDFNRIINYSVPSFVIIMMLSIVVCIIDNMTGFSKSVFGDMEKGMDTAINFFLVEVQVAFITLSLSTALSTSSKRVYWEETYTYRLISPVVTNFTALSAYILAALCDGLIWSIIGSLTDICSIACIFLSFLITIILLILLSARMIDANFGREAIKKELEEELQKKYEKLPGTYHIGMDKGRMLPEIQKLKQITIQEITEKELDLVSENMYLLQKFGFKNELDRLYRYAKKEIGSDIVMHEIDLMIMKNVIQDNNMDFFYVSCPISDDLQYELWEDVIHVIFDESQTVWLAGNKEEAWKKRKNLYIMLTKYLYYKKIWIEAPLYDEENNVDVMPSEEQMAKEWVQIINLMVLFVSRRENDNYGSTMDESLGDEWEQSERNMIDMNELTEDYEGIANGGNELDELVEDVTEILERWGQDKWEQYAGSKSYIEKDKAKRY